MKTVFKFILTSAVLLASWAQAGSIQAPQYLQRGASVFSDYGTYRLTLQSGDGNLVLYRVSDNAVIWSSYSPGGTAAKMQEDRNFVVYSNGGFLPQYAIWSTDTYRNVWDTQARLEVREDGSLYLYKENFAVVWATPADPARANLGFGKVNFTICLRPGTNAQQTQLYLAENYGDAKHYVDSFVNAGAVLFECK